jgi:aspartate/methionine/tyrosine aminotransferase
MEIMERAKVLEARGEHIIYLCLGEPDFPTPGPVVEACVEALHAATPIPSAPWSCARSWPATTGAATAWS